jgi:hypothetical protein
MLDGRRYVSGGAQTCALALFLCSIAHAASGWTSYGTIEEIYPTAAGGFYVKLDVESLPHQCARPEWFYNDGTSAGANRVFATLLAAKTSGAPVRVHLLGSCESWGAAEFSSASMK